MEEDKYHGNYVLRVTEEQRDGHVYERAYIRPGVTVFPIIDSDHIRFINEISWDDGQTYLKPVTGYIEDDESPEVCATRELREELGLHTNHWQLVDQYQSDEATVKKVQYFFAAFFMENPRIEPNPESGEQIEDYVDLHIAAIRRMIMNGEFGTTPTALVLLKIIERLELHG